MDHVKFAWIVVERVDAAERRKETKVIRATTVIKV
jgi:hypothetical protein